MLKGVAAIVLGVEDISAARRFYTDFGLAEAEKGTRLSSFSTFDSSIVTVKSKDDSELPPAICDGSTIRELIWAVDSGEDIQRIAAELSIDRKVHLDGDGVLHSNDDDGYAIAFQVDRRATLAPSPNRTNVFGAEPNRVINSTIDFHEAMKPASIAHVVVFSSDVNRAEQFYVQRLGFRVSDRFHAGKGVFLRAPGSTYHHTLFIIHAPKPGLHHVAFHVRDFTDVMNGGVSLLKAGWEPTFGPGRHILGANYFWYFASPCGGAMELTADMDRVDDNWTPREIPFAPENIAAWSMTFNQPAAR